MHNDCVFCKIIAGELPSYKVWEDGKHMAFLSLHPNTEGFTVVVSKKHYESYAFEQTDEVLTGIVLAAKTVGQLLDAAFDDVGRTGLIMEGFGVNHLHAKLVPMHGTKSGGWKQRAKTIDTFFEYYKGYISSHDAPQASQRQLEGIANKIRKTASKEL